MLTLAPRLVAGKNVKDLMTVYFEWDSMADRHRQKPTLTRAHSHTHATHLPYTDNHTYKHSHTHNHTHTHIHMHTYKWIFVLLFSLTTFIYFCV